MSTTISNKPLCNCGKELNEYGGCHHCGFDATEGDIY